MCKPLGSESAVRVRLRLGGFMMAEARERRRLGLRSQEAGVTRGQGPGEPVHGAFRPQLNTISVGIGNLKWSECY